MTVEELIEAPQKVPSTATVVFDYNGGESW